MPPLQRIHLRVEAGADLLPVHAQLERRVIAEDLESFKASGIRAGPRQRFHLQLNQNFDRGAEVFLGMRDEITPK